MPLVSSIPANIAVKKVSTGTSKCNQKSTSKIYMKLNLEVYPISAATPTEQKYWAGTCQAGSFVCVCSPPPLFGLPGNISNGKGGRLTLLVSQQESIEITSWFWNERKLPKQETPRKTWTGGIVAACLHWLLKTLKGLLQSQCFSVTYISFQVILHQL